MANENFLREISARNQPLEDSTPRGGGDGMKSRVGFRSRWREKHDFWVAVTMAGLCRRQGGAPSASRNLRSITKFKPRGHHDMINNAPDSVPPRRCGALPASPAAFRETLSTQVVVVVVAFIPVCLCYTNIDAWIQADFYLKKGRKVGSTTCKAFRRPTPPRLLPRVQDAL